MFILRQRNIRRFLLLLVSAVTLLHFYFINFEFALKQPFSSRYFWYLQHDEKIMVPDARYFFLNNSQPISILDYKPPMSAYYGVASSLLTYEGFKLFGMNNTGLRFFPILVSTVTTLFCVFLLLRIVPGLIGLLCSMLYICSYNNFVLNQHAIVENFLTFSLVFILWLYSTKKVWFMKYLERIAFASGIIVLFKFYFPCYILLLLILIALVENQGRVRILRLALLWGMGVVFFETVQLLILSSNGIAQYRYEPIVVTVLNQLGFMPKISYGAVHPFPSVEIMILQQFPAILAQWYLGINFPILVEISFAWIFLGLVLAGIFLGRRKILPKEVFVIVLFLAILLAASSFAYFYTKRAFSLFPYMLIFLSSFFYCCRKYIAGKISVLFYRVLGAALVILVLIYSVRQVALIIKTGIQRHAQVGLNSKALDNVVPEGSVIYAHCYPYRFFWQAKQQRLISGDDVAFSQMSILRRAVQNQGRYVFMSLQGVYGWASQEEGIAGEVLFRKLLYNQEIKGVQINDPDILDTLSKIKEMKLIKSYVTEYESDSPNQYFLYEIIYK